MIPGLDRARKATKLFTCASLGAQFVVTTVKADGQCDCEFDGYLNYQVPPLKDSWFRSHEGAKRPSDNVTYAVRRSSRDKEWKRPLAKQSG